MPKLRFDPSQVENMQFITDQLGEKLDAAQAAITGHGEAMERAGGSVARAGGEFRDGGQMVAQAGRDVLIGMLALAVALLIATAFGRGAR